MGDYQSEPITFNCWRNGEIGYICWKDDTKFRKREREEEKKREKGIFMVKCPFTGDKIHFSRDTKTCKLRHHSASQTKEIKESS